MSVAVASRADARAGGQVAASSDPVAAWLGTWLIYGGAAQLAVLDVLSHGSGRLTATIVGLLVNLRLAAFSTAMVPGWRSASLRRRLAAGLMLTDAPWAVARTRVRGQQAFYLGAAASLFVLWPLLVTVGVLVGGYVDGLAVTSLLVPLTLGALVVPSCVSGLPLRRWWRLPAAPCSPCGCRRESLSRWPVWSAAWPLS